MTQKNKYAGLGMDTFEVGPNIPMIRLIQDGSPEVKTSHERYDLMKIEGAKAGQIVFTSTSEVFDEIEVIPLIQQSRYTLWRPRGQGGIIGTTDLSIVTHPDYKQVGNKETIGENELAYTMYFFILFLDTEQEWQPAVIAMASSQLKVGRAWNKMILSFKYPDSNIKAFSFSRSYILGSFIEKNKKGDAFYNYTLRSGNVLDFDEDKDILELCASSIPKAKKTLPDPMNSDNLLTAAKNIEDNPF